MSTATEFAPSIRIPDRARPRRTSAVVLPFPCDRMPRAAVAAAPPLRRWLRLRAARRDRDSTDPARLGGSCSRGRDSTRRCALACPVQR